MSNKEFNLDGFDEFGDQLAALARMYRADLVVRNTLTKAVKVSLTSAYSTAYSLAKLGPPNKENIHMKETLRIDARIPNAKDKMSYFVNEGDVVIGILSVKKSAVSLANEFGTSKMAANPFLRPALQENAEAGLTELKSQLAVRIPDYAKKLARRKK